MGHGRAMGDGPLVMKPKFCQDSVHIMSVQSLSGVSTVVLKVTFLVIESSRRIRNTKWTVNMTWAENQ